MIGRHVLIAVSAIAIVLGSTLAALVITGQPGGSSDNPAYAQEIGENGGIEVDGEGQVAVSPDVSRLNVGVELEGENLAELRGEVNSRMDAIVEALRDHGVAETDIRTVRYDISIVDDVPPEPADTEQQVEQDPVTDPDDDTVVEDEASVEVEDDVVEGADALRFRVVSQVEVTVRDIDDTGDVLDAALDGGANTVGQIRFDVENQQDAIREARELAVEDARDKAEHLAELTGINLGAPLQIHESSPPGPVARGEVDAVEVADDAAVIEPGESVVHVRVHIVYAIE